MLVLGAIFAAVGLLFIALAIPLARRRVPPNGLYGLRVPATFADEEVWYEANAASGRDFIVLGIVLVLLPLGLGLVPGLTEGGFTLALAGATVAGAIVVAGVGWRRANRLLRERRAPSR